MAGTNTGKITQIIGAVLDVKFQEGKLPEINEAIKGCKLLMPSNKGCFQCQDGYHKKDNGKKSEKCNESCKTCFKQNDCDICNSSYWRKPEASGLCQPFKTLTNCKQENIIQYDKKNKEITNPKTKKKNPFNPQRF